MRTQKLVANTLWMSLRTIISVLGPLITLPYITRVLQVENIGKINFLESVISYFIMFAGSGVSYYAIREGSAYRDDQQKLSVFASEIFTINIVASVISYGLFFFCLLCIEKFRNDKVALVLYSTGILFGTLATEWIFSIKENYSFLSMKMLIQRLLTIVLVFIFIKKQDDMQRYIIICTVVPAFFNLICFIRANQWCRIHLTRHCHWKKHWKPICTLFAGEIATSIYLKMDNLLLGFMATEYALGLYAISTKIYSMIKLFIATVITVSVPRLAFYLRNEREHEYRRLWNKLFWILIEVALPAVTGLLLIGPQIIRLLVGERYSEAIKSLRYLTVALLPALIGWLYIRGTLTVTRNENKVMLATVVGGCINVLLNVVLIPRGYEVAAAMTTLIAEVGTMSIGIYFGKKYTVVHWDRREITGAACGSFFIAIYVQLIKCIAKACSFFTWSEVLVCVVGSFIGYTFWMIACKTTLWLEIRKYLSHSKC